MPEWKPACPKCNSTSVTIDRDYRAWGQGSFVMTCYPCGNTVYGREKIEPMLIQQRQEWETRVKAEAEERRLAELAAERQRKEALRLRAEAALKAQQAYLESRCEVPGCDNERAPGKKYCTPRCGKRWRDREYRRRVRAKQKQQASL